MIILLIFFFLILFLLINDKKKIFNVVVQCLIEFDCLILFDEICNVKFKTSKISNLHRRSTANNKDKREI